MRKNGTYSVKAIAGMGLFSFVLLMGVLFGMRNYARSADAQRVPPVRAQSPFQGERAFELLEQVVGLGPRPSGSPSLERLREMIRNHLRSYGLEIREHAFAAATPAGEIPMVNIVGIVKGEKPGVLILSNHYETKRFADITFVGANDGGATTAWMLEMARVLGPTREGRSIWLCFFDGEEALIEWSESDSLYGSRAFVEELRREGRLQDIRVVINVDMIGDCYLGIREDRGAPRWLTQTIWTTAAQLGYRRWFQPFAHMVQDDHIPFQRAGIPAINLIDFTYGSNVSEHRQTWHTENDTIDRVCADSLQIVGDVIYHAIPKIEGQLDGM